MEGAAIDQAVAEMRARLADCRLEVESESRYFTVCVAATVAFAALRSLLGQGVPFETAERVVLTQFAGLRPDDMQP